jgi:hypothetical protein
MSTKNTAIGRLSRAFSMVGAAISVSAMVEGRRRPRSEDLLTLGIDPKAFDKIG